MKKFQKFIFFQLVIFCAVGRGQTITEGRLRYNHKTISYSYLEPNQKAIGILILFPGWGESSQSVFTKTELPFLLAKEGYITIVPQLKEYLFADEELISDINEILKGKFRQYQSNLILGGFSAGGAIAIGYAEKMNSSIRPRALFAIDPPLDLDRVYRSAENKIGYDCKNKLISDEGKRIKKHLLKALKASPAEHPEIYVQYSAFSASIEDGGNAKYLKGIPIRLYTEADLEFVRTAYCKFLQFEDINATDLAMLEKRNSNPDIEYITTKNRGFHSWNILEPVDCVQWIVKHGR